MAELYYKNKTKMCAIDHTYTITQSNDLRNITRDEMYKRIFENRRIGIRTFDLLSAKGLRNIQDKSFLKITTRKISNKKFDLRRVKQSYTIRI